MINRSVKHLLIGILLTCISMTTLANNETQPQRSPLSAKPFSMMAKLSKLAGHWELQTLYSANAGQDWQDMGTIEVEIGYDQRELMMYERPVSPNEKGFNMVSYITYDQYRQVYRKAAIDDIWGIMDIYTGNIDEDKLVLTNLTSGTLFPEGDGRLRGFRLTLELQGERRVMTIEATLDDGKTWFPNFKNIYVKKP